MEDRSIEVSAPDVEEAIEHGLALLGLAREEASIEIVDQGSRGLFGIGARDAVVRLQPIAPRTQAVVTPQRPTMLETEPEANEEPADQASAEPEPHDEYVLSQEQIADIARQTLAELLGKMGIECQILIREEKTTDGQPSPITVDVLGDHSEILIGRHGEVLDALQYIARLIVSREVQHWVNLVVDVENYKRRRAKSLTQLAERIAERVAHTKQPVALEPMPPNERRVIHITLHDHPAVTTQSVGKGENRKVTIIPRR